MSEEKLDGSQNLTFAINNNFNKQTGRLMFKFDDDEPQECAIIYDYGKVTIQLQQEKMENLLQQTTSIEFTSKDDKKFRLFIENSD